MSSEFERTIEERRLTPIKADKGMILKEMREAEADLIEAKDSLGRDRYKWATIQGYYSMFHAARALIYSKGFREKSHHALLVALRHLLPREIGMKLIRSFENAIHLREEADYGLTFSQSGAKQIIEDAEEFLKKARGVLRI